MVYDELKDVMYTAYERYLMRDLVYVASGSLFIISSYYLIEGEIATKGFIKIITQDIPIFLLFLIFSYFTGLIAQESCRYIKIKTKEKEYSLIEMSPYPQKEGYYESLLYNIRKKFDKGTIRGYERTVFIKTIGSAFCSVGFLFLVIFLVSIILINLNKFSLDISFSIYGGQSLINLKLILLLLGMTFLLIFGHHHNKKILDYQNKTLKDLEKKLKPPRKPRKKPSKKGKRK